MFLVIFSLALSGTLIAEQFFTPEIEQFVLGVQTER